MAVVFTVLLRALFSSVFVRAAEEDVAGSEEAEVATVATTRKPVVRWNEEVRQNMPHSFLEETPSGEIVLTSKSTMFGLIFALGAIFFAPGKIHFFARSSLQKIPLKTPCFDVKKKSTKISGPLGI